MYYQRKCGSTYFSKQFFFFTNADFINVPKLTSVPGSLQYRDFFSIIRTYFNIVNFSICDFNRSFLNWCFFFFLLLDRFKSVINPFNSSSYLPGLQLDVASRACKRFREIIMQDRLWEALTREGWPNLSRENQSWRQVYLSLRRRKIAIYLPLDKLNFNIV